MLEKMVGASGIEPPTTTMSRWCSTTELRACTTRAGFYLFCLVNFIRSFLDENDLRRLAIPFFWYCWVSSGRASSGDWLKLPDPTAMAQRRYCPDTKIRRPTHD